MNIILHDPSIKKGEREKTLICRFRLAASPSRLQPIAVRMLFFIATHRFATRRPIPASRLHRNFFATPSATTHRFFFFLFATASQLLRDSIAARRTIASRRLLRDSIRDHTQVFLFLVRDCNSSAFSAMFFLFATAVQVFI